MTQEQKEQKQENAADPDTGADDDDSEQVAQQMEEQQVEEAKETMSDLEDGDPPKDLADWPGGKAKYLTYGGRDGGESYGDGATSKLGPSSLRHHEDGSVTIEGEEVDDPDEYKGDPIPGGPSDPDAPPDPAMVGEEGGSDSENSGDRDSDSDSDSDEEKD